MILGRCMTAPNEATPPRRANATASGTVGDRNDSTTCLVGRRMKATPTAPQTRASRAYVATIRQPPRPRSHEARHDSAATSASGGKHGRRYVASFERDRLKKTTAKSTKPNPTRPVSLIRIVQGVATDQGNAP